MDLVTSRRTTTQSRRSFMPRSRPPFDRVRSQNDSNPLTPAFPSKLRNALLDLPRDDALRRAHLLRCWSQTSDLLPRDTAPFEAKWPVARSVFGSVSIPPDTYAKLPTNNETSG
jgi:hypothetical protein